jgi:hypothetical protein
VTSLTVERRSVRLTVAGAQITLTREARPVALAVGGGVTVTGGAAGEVAWPDITGKPATFPPDLTAHLGAADPHPQYLTAAEGTAAFATAAEGALAGTALQPGAQIPWTDVTGKPATFPPDLTAHLGAADPHPQYLTAAEGSAAFATAAQGALAGTALQPGAQIPWTDVTGRPATFPPDLTAHLGAADPHPQYLTTAEGTAAFAALGHGHAAATGAAAGFMAAADKAKLDGIATGATANAADAALRDRATHTGTQAASTISDFGEAVDDRVAALLVAGAGVSLTYDDSAGTLAVAATGGGGGDGFPLGLYSDGSDGDVTISSGTTTLTRDMSYNTLTISGSGVLNTAGFRVFVKDTLDISAAGAGAIHCNGAIGNNGGVTGTGGGAAASAQSSIINITTRNAGGAGGTAAGTAGPTLGSITLLVSGGMGVGGSGGAGSSGGGGPGSSQVAAATITTSFRRYIHDFIGIVNGVMNCYTNGRSCSGGGGGGDGTAGGGGGSGGAPGNGMAIYARRIQRGTNTTAAIIQARGGPGGNGGSPAAGNRGGGGGGSGGGGGMVYICHNELLGTEIADAIDVSGGAGGNGGNGSGTGIGGQGGGRGGGGRVVIFNLLTGATSKLDPVSGAAGGAASGATGGTGAAQVIARFAL